MAAQQRQVICITPLSCLLVVNYSRTSCYSFVSPLLVIGALSSSWGVLATMEMAQYLRGQVVSSCFRAPTMTWEHYTLSGCLVGRWVIS